MTLNDIQGILLTLGMHEQIQFRKHGEGSIEVIVSKGLAEWVSVVDGKCLAEAIASDDSWLLSSIIQRGLDQVRYMMSNDYHCSKGKSVKPLTAKEVKCGMLYMENERPRYEVISIRRSPKEIQMELSPFGTTTKGLSKHWRSFRPDSVVYVIDPLD